MAIKVGLVGLGRMGRAIYTRLTENGCEVMAWDRDERAMKSAAEHQVRLADSPRAAAAFGDVVISTITEDHGVRGIFNGANGFLSGDVKGKLFIEMSTLQPMTGRELAPTVTSAGARLINSPVFGTIPHVQTGQALRNGRRQARGHRARPAGSRKARRQDRAYGPERRGLCDEACGQSRPRKLRADHRRVAGARRARGARSQPDDRHSRRSTDRQRLVRRQEGRARRASPPTSRSI